MTKVTFRHIPTLLNLCHLNKWTVFCIAFITTSVLSANDKIDWSWTLERAAIYDSLISIQNKDNLVTQHAFDCNLIDAVSVTSVEEPAASIDIIVTSLHPKGLLVVTCNFGAHSERIIIIDPNIRTQQIVFRKTGSYFVDWKLDNGQLHISYDKPAKNKKNSSGELAFVTEKVIW